MPSNASEVIDEVIELLLRSGGEEYFGEAVSKLQHAEQCASHARNAGADEVLILASLLHNIGPLLECDGALRDERVGVINHDEIGQAWLRSRGFSVRLAALLGGHVDAKRYLTAMNPGYLARLSPASIETLRLQGGPMNESSAAAFAKHWSFETSCDCGRGMRWPKIQIGRFRELSRTGRYSCGTSKRSKRLSGTQNIDDRRQIL